MPRISIALCFCAFTFLGFYLLFIFALGLHGGGNGHLLRGLDSPSLLCNPGGGVRLYYTGIPIVDDVMCKVVTFFQYLLAGPSAYLFGTLLLSNGPSIFSLLYLEAARAQHRSSPLRYLALPTGLAFQCLGAGAIIPLWFALYSLWGNPSAVATLEAHRRSARETKAVLWGTMFGGLIPTIALLGGPVSWDVLGWQMSFRKWQEVIVFWQLFPLWTSLGCWFVKLFIPLVRYSDVKTATRATQRAFGTVLIFYGIISTISYYMVIAGCIYISRTTSQPLYAVVGSLFTAPLQGQSFGDIARLFIIFDGAMLFVSSLLFVTIAPGTKGSVTRKLVAIVMLTIWLGPGAAISWGWWRREREMTKFEERKSKAVKTE